MPLLLPGFTAMNSCTRSIRAAKAPCPAAQHGARPGIQHADGAGTEVLAPAVDADVVKRKDAPAACIHEHPLWSKADHRHPPARTALRGGSYGHGPTGHHCRQK